MMQSRSRPTLPGYTARDYPEPDALNATHDRSMLAIGVETWLKRDLSRFERVLRNDVALDSLMVPTSNSYSAFRKVFPASEVSDKTLIEHGRQALEIGTNPRVEWIDYLFAGNNGAGVHVRAPPDFSLASWGQFDGTYGGSYKKAIDKPSRFTIWTPNSCSVDATISALIASGAVVRQADQIPLSHWLRVPDTAVTMRLALSKDWQSLPWAPSRLTAMNSIFASLSTSKFDFESEQIADANEVALAVKQNGALPSQTTVLVNSFICCDGTRRFICPDQAHTEYAQWQVWLHKNTDEDLYPDQALGDIFYEQYFGATSFDDPEGQDPNRSDVGAMRAPFPPCSKGVACLQLYKKEPVVLGRLAPELNIQISGGAPLLERGREWFGPLSVQHTVVKKVMAQAADTASGKRVERYQEVLVQCDYEVYTVVDQRNSHFTTVVRDLQGHKPGVYRIDGLRGDGPVRMGDEWRDAWPLGQQKSTRLMSVTYRLKDRYIIEHSKV